MRCNGGQLCFVMGEMDSGQGKRPPQPRQEEELSADQRQEGSGGFGVMGRLPANSHCGQVGTEAHRDPSWAKGLGFELLSLPLVQPALPMPHGAPNLSPHSFLFHPEPICVLE